jgi:hypothetical protein
MRLSELLPLVRDSLADPRAAYRRLAALELDRATLWQAMIATSIVAVVLFAAGDYLAGLRGERSWLPFLPGPVALAFISFASQALAANLLLWGGRMVGGTGRLEGALITTVWTQFVNAVLVVVQMILMLLLPPLAGVVGLASVVAFFWVLSGFTAEMHGFRSIGRTLAGIIIGLLGVSLALVVVLTVIGLGLPEAADV